MNIHGIVWMLLLTFTASLMIIPGTGADTTPPAEPVKLVFIHHSVGEHWLADENGGLARALGENNYFVSDTYYGWGPDGIGDRTDIVDWPEWFLGEGRDRYMDALFSESRDDAAGYEYYNRPMSDPGGENRIILFKSCYPNSNLAGNPTDPVSEGPDMTVGGAKYVYTRLLEFFEQHPDKLFIAMTPPPELSSDHAASAEAFSRWMTEEWLDSYPGTNVGVFDLHAVLSSPDNHHTAEGDTVIYETSHGNTLAFPTEDPHPSQAGNRKATREFVPLLNYFYNRWMSGDTAPHQPSVPEGSGTLEPVIPDHPAEQVVSEEEKDRAIPGLTDPEEPGIMEEENHTGTTADAGFVTSPDGRIEGPWTVYDDGASGISLTSGDEPASFCLEVTVIPGGWATVETLADEPQDWSEYQGISFSITADHDEVPYSLVLYDAQGSEGKTGYGVSRITGPGADSDGEEISIPWSSFESLEGAGEFQPDIARGLFFAIETGDGEPVRICISGISLTRA